jgi:hypothetical protein
VDVGLGTATVDPVVQSAVVSMQAMLPPVSL